MINEEITNFIPQRPPFVMIDKLVKADDSVSQTIFTIREGHLFVEDGTFTESGLVENMAQTAAAGIGYKTYLEGREVPLGYIAAIKNLNLKELPKIGDTITTEMHYTGLIMSMHIVKGIIKVGDKEIVSSEFRIFEKKD